MSRTADGGGGGDGFPHTSRYDPGAIVASSETMSGGPHSQSTVSHIAHVAMNLNPAGLSLNIASGIYHSIMGDGARDKVASALKPTDPGKLLDHSKKWGTVSSEASGYATAVSKAMSALSSWTGDDAEKAKQVLQGLAATFGSASTAAYTMSYQLGEMASTLQWAKDNYGDSGGVMDDAANVLTGGSEDDDAANAYQNMLKNFQTSMGYMPDKVPYEVKSDQQLDAPPAPSPPTPTTGVGGAPSVGGAGTAPHTGNTTPPHIPKTPTTGPTQPPHHGPTTGPTIPPTSGPTEPPGWNSTDPGGVGSGSYPGGGAGIGTGGLDTSGSLAGYQPSGGAGGAGSLGGMPATGAGSGAGVGGAGAGAGGLAAGAGSSGGAGGGAGGGGVLGGAAGGRGMMPMHGSHGDDEDERERNTWLTEDEDVWGAEESSPGVIR